MPSGCILNSYNSYSSNFPLLWNEVRFVLALGDEGKLLLTNSLFQSVPAIRRTVTLNNNPH